MDIVVKDTNIIIDLINIGLSRFFRLLPIECHTTRQVIQEISDEEQLKKVALFIEDGTLIVDSFREQDLDLLIDTTMEYGKITNLTEADCSVMLLAERYGCCLLTSDQKLRKQAKERGLQVNGLLWIVDIIVEKGILSGREMIPYLLKYLESNIRAPKNDVNRRIERYSTL